MNTLYRTLKVCCYLIIAASTSLSTAKADVLFEGYYRIETNSKHVGYVIQRYEIHEKTKSRVMTTYQRRKSGDALSETITKSEVKDVKSDKGSKLFVPSSVNYISDETGAHVRIQSTFAAANKAKVEIYFDKSKKPSEVKTEEAGPNAFISNFLFYIVAQSHGGNLESLPTQTTFPYEAYSESDGRYSDGYIHRLAEKSTAGTKVLQIADYFAGETLETFVLPNGDMIGARGSETVVYLVKDRAAAVGLLEFSQNRVTETFGDLPDGKKNPLATVDVDVYKLMNSFSNLKELKEQRIPNSVPDELAEPNSKNQISLPVLPEGKLK